MKQEHRDKAKSTNNDNEILYYHSKNESNKSDEHVEMIEILKEVVKSTKVEEYIIN